MKKLLLPIIGIFVFASIMSSCNNDDDNEACVESTWYQDDDNDGLGNPDASVQACDQPDGYVANNDDTEDNSAECKYEAFSDEQQACDLAVGDPSITITTDESADTRTIVTNGLPDHGIGSVQAVGIEAEAGDYTLEVDLTPEKASEVTEIFPDRPTYYVGVALNGVLIDNAPGIAVLSSDDGLPSIGPDLVYEPTMIDPLTSFIDCNDGHVGIAFSNYHYHGDASEYASSTLGADGTKMVLFGWAADGFPIYYKYAYSTASNANSAVIEMESSYQVKEGSRTGDGESAPCGDYDGTIWGDWEYVSGSGDLDECHGRTGVTPEFPDGTYYYVVTGDTPSLPRCLVGTPSEDFSLGLGGM